MVTTRQALAEAAKNGAGKAARNGRGRVNYSLPASSDDLELVSYIRNLFIQARQHRRPYVSQWNKNYQILRNRTWGTRANWLPAPEVPEIYPIIAAQVGWMTDQRPTLEVVPSSEPYSSYHQFWSQLAHDLQTVLQTNWLVHEQEAEVEQVIWDGFTYGGGILKTTWDHALVGGQGDASSRRVDPYTFYPDPQATSIADSNYFIEARTMSLQELDRRWPGSAKKFADTGFTEDVDQPPSFSDSSIPRANPGALSPATSSHYGLVGQSRQRAVANDPGITVLEAWLREHEVIDNPEDPDDIGVEDTWRVVVIAGNQVLMNERASELWSHSQHPYDRYVPHRTGEFWGLSMVDMLRPSQIAINRLLAALQLNIELVGNPVFLESTRSQVGRQKITNRPGQRLTHSDGAEPKWLSPPQIHPMMAELIRFYIEEMERISGLTAIAKGMAPGGRNAQGVVEAMQESSFVRVRMALRNLEWALRAAGEKQAALITENYTTPRVVAYTGPNGEKSSLALHGHHFYIPSESGRTPMRFQLLIQAGSQMSTSRNARKAEASTLFAMGALDTDAVLEAYDWPNRREIAHRINQLKAAGAFEPPGARQRAKRSS